MVLAAMQMACVMLEKDDTNWFAEIDVDTHRIQEIIGQIFSLYEMCKTFNEKREIQRLLAKMPKPKMQPSVRFFLHANTVCFVSITLQEQIQINSLINT